MRTEQEIEEKLKELQIIRDNTQARIDKEETNWIMHITVCYDKQLQLLKWMLEK